MDWWLVEYDPAEALGFGYVCLGDAGGTERGLVSLVELEAVRVPLRGAFDGFSVVVERDVHWQPKTAEGAPTRPVPVVSKAGASNLRPREARSTGMRADQ